MLQWYASLAVLSIVVAQAGVTAAAVPFTIAAIPDSQNHFKTSGVPATPSARFATQMGWIANNVASQNIVFVTHAGDITSGDSYDDAAAGMYMLDPSGVPWGTVPGNHDFNYGNLYLQYWGADHFAGKSWYGGSSLDLADPALRGYSSYVIFQGGGRTFLGLQIENNASSNVLAWAQSVLNAHPNIPVVVTTHDYLNDAGGRTTYGDTLWNTLVKPNDQIFMVWAGHVHTADGEYNQTSYNDLGRPVFEMMANYQGYSYDANGRFRLITFDEDASQINVKSYCAWDNTYWTDADSQFTLSMDFNSRLGAVPEPGTLLLLAFGGAVLGALAVRRRGWSP